MIPGKRTTTEVFIYYIPEKSIHSNSGIFSPTLLLLTTGYNNVAERDDLHICKTFVARAYKDVYDAFFGCCCLAKVKTTTVQNCFRKCFGDEQAGEVEPVPEEQIPTDFSREVWESQIDLEVRMGTP